MPPREVFTFFLSASATQGAASTNAMAIIRITFSLCMLVSSPFGLLRLKIPARSRIEPVNTASGAKTSPIIPARARRPLSEGYVSAGRVLLPPTRAWGDLRWSRAGLFRANGTELSLLLTFYLNMGLIRGGRTRGREHE